MKSVKKIVVVGGLVLGLTSANALQWVDTQLNPSGNAGTFDIATLGYDPLIYVLDSAKIEFQFQGVGTLETFLFGTFYAVSAVTTVGNYSGLNASNPNISYGGGGPLNASQLADLGADGLFGYSAALGDWGSSLTVTSAKLTVQGSERPSPVPDGGAAAALLGFAVLAIGALMRRI